MTLALSFFALLNIGLVLVASKCVKSVGLLVVSLLSFIALIALVAYQIDPPLSWDLSRHYAEIDRMKAGGWNYVWSQGRYRNLPISNLLFYIVSLLPSERFLPVIGVVLSYGILLFIILSSIRKFQPPGHVVAIAFIVAFALSDGVYLISGVRAVLSASIAGLAVYVDFFCARRFKVASIGLYLCATLVHNLMLVVIALRLISLLPIKRFGFASVAIFFWPVFVTALMPLAQSFGYDLLEQTSIQLSVYSSTDSLSSASQTISLILALTMVLPILYKASIIPDLSMSSRGFFMSCMLWAMLGSLAFIPLITWRLSYVVAFLSVPIIFVLHKESRTKRQGVITIFDAILLFCAIVKIIYFYYRMAAVV